jgi:serine/threonine protein kinase
MTLERGTLLYNRYRIVEILGQGGMGSVYRAVDENLGVDVAVKENLFTTEEYARQFRLEAIILANLRHPNLPRVTDHFVIEDQGQYLVMDYIEGEDLRQRMERVGKLSEDEVIMIGVAMCDALSYLHSRRPPILHRDVKPGNVKITPEGQIFLVDFGLAKVVQGSQVTTTGARAMTPGYSPPEQYGTARTDPRTDIYSLGATLYAALTGVIPEDGLARAMDNATLTPVRKRNPKVSRRLAAAIEKAMAIDSEERFQTAEEFQKALLTAKSRTQRRIASGDIRVEPPPSDEGDKNIHEDETQGGLLLPPEPPLLETGHTSKKKKKRSRGCLFYFLIFLILLISGFAIAAYIDDDLRARALSYLFFPSTQGTVFPQEAPPTETAFPAAETKTVLAPPITPLPTSTPTLTPTVTFTPTPTNTFTPTPTPLGGGRGQIAFVSDRTGVPQIFLLNVDGSGEWPITNLPEGACQPDWSPDGLYLVFVSPCAMGEDVQRGSSLFITNIDGTEFRQLPTAPGGDFEPAWSPDGRTIVFTSLRDGYMQLYAFNLEDETVTRLTQTTKSAEARQAAWSPFGNLIAYAVKRYGAYQIWTMTNLGQAPQRLTVSGPTFWDLLPVWAPDGETIFYNQRRAEQPTLEWLMKIRYEDRGSAGDRVDAGNLPVMDMDYSPDGFWMTFVSMDDAGNLDIYMMSAAGGSRTRLTRDPAADFQPVWRPFR